MMPPPQPVARHQAHPADGHDVLYFAGDYPAEEIASFLDEAAERGGRSLLVATWTHARRVRRRLRHPEALATLDARRTYRRIVRRGALDHEAFARVLGTAVEQARAHGGPVHAFGELVVLACRKGHPHVAIDLERAWNQLLARQHASLLCAYPDEAVPSIAVRGHIDAQHRRRSILP